MGSPRMEDGVLVVNGDQAERMLRAAGFVRTFAPDGATGTVSLDEQMHAAACREIGLDPREVPNPVEVRIER